MPRDPIYSLPLSGGEVDGLGSVLEQLGLLEQF